MRQGPDLVSAQPTWWTPCSVTMPGRSRRVFKHKAKDRCRGWLACPHKQRNLLILNFCALRSAKEPPRPAAIEQTHTGYLLCMTTPEPDDATVAEDAPNPKVPPAAPAYSAPPPEGPPDAEHDQ
jgi:hypothetical protein